MSSLNRCESVEGSFASGEREDDRRGEVVWIGRDGDMRSGRVRMRDAGVEPRVVRGRRGRETLGTSDRKKVKRGSIRLNIHDSGVCFECGCMTVEDSKWSSEGQFENLARVLRNFVYVCQGIHVISGWN
jgi:hypothetical protein